MIFNFLSCMWLSIMNRPTDSYLSDYINSFYFLTETSTTIGYGDNTVTINSSIPVNTPPNESQYLFGTLLILFGLIFFGYISRLVVMTYLLWFQNEKASLDQKEDLSDWIAARNRKIAGGMPYNYERKINEHITFIYLQDVASCVNETAYLDQISNGIKFSVLKSATFKLISSFEFLHFLPLPIAIDIVTQSVPQNFISGEIIIKKGEKSKGVYFILSGQVGVMQAVWISAASARTGWPSSPGDCSPTRRWRYGSTVMSPRPTWLNWRTASALHR